MRALDVLDLIIILEALLCTAMICKHLHTAYKHMERKRRIKVGSKLAAICDAD